MTIKQQGGVFGRNPTFNDVTIDGTLTFNGDIDIDSDLKVSGDLDVTGAANLDGSVTINESAADKDFRVEGTTDSYLIYADADQQSVGIGISNPNSYAFNDPVKLAVGNTSGSTTLSIVSNPSSFGYLAFADGTSGASRYAGRIEYQHGTGSMYFYVNDGSQNINISSSGNLAFPSGQGIDFSATGQAPGMTSELLDDYEEGTWTATITDGANNATMGGGGVCQYTKVGRLVTVHGYIYTTSLGSVTGSLSISGLPFSPLAGGTNYTASTAGFGDSLAITAGQSVALRFTPSSLSIGLFLWDAATGSTAMQGTEWTSNGELMFSASYLTA